MFPSQDWPLWPVGPPRSPGPRPLPLPGPSPRAAQAPQGAEATRRAPPPQPGLPREKIAPLLCPRAAPRLRLCLGPQPRCQTPNAPSLTDQAPPDPVTVPQSQGSPAAPATALSSTVGPACHSQQPPGRPPAPTPRLARHRLLPQLGAWWSPAVASLPFPRASPRSHHRPPERPPLPQQPPRLPGCAALGAALTGRGTCAPAG